MSVMCSSEKVSAFAVQTPIELFCFVSRDLRPQKKACFKNRCIVIWDTEVMNHNHMQTQISSFVLVFLMLFVRYDGTWAWLSKQYFLWLFSPLYLCGEPKFSLWLTLKELVKTVTYTFFWSLPCTTLGSDSPPYASPVFCPTCQNPSPALCKSLLPRHSSACVSCWNSLPKHLDPKFYLCVLLFEVHTEIHGFGIWRLLSSPILPEREKIQLDVREQVVKKQVFYGA